MLAVSWHRLDSQPGVRVHAYDPSTWEHGAELTRETTDRQTDRQTEMGSHGASQPPTPNVPINFSLPSSRMQSLHFFSLLFLSIKPRVCLRAAKQAQQVRCLPRQPDNLSLSPKPSEREEKPTPQSYPLSSTHSLTSSHTHITRPQ